MTPERTPPHDPNPEDGPPEHLRAGPEATQVARVVIDALADSDAKLRVIEGLLNYGTPFAAYLTLPDTAAEDPTVVDRFRDVYADSWEDLDEYIDEQIADQGWHEALAEFRITQGIGEDVLDWNRDALLAQAREMFDFVPLDGWWHLFVK